MCNCFREGRTTDPPVPREWLVIDADGHIALLPERESGDLDRKVYEWEQSCCPHPGMDFACERIANWSGYRLFQEALAAVGPEHFPVLQSELPNSNGGVMSPRAASDALEELAYFSSLDVVGSNAFLVNTLTGESIFQHIACYEGIFILDGRNGVDVGIGEFEFFIRCPSTGTEHFRATRFHQSIKNRDHRKSDDEPLQVEYVDLDTGERFQCNTAVSGNTIPWPDGRMQNDEGKCRFEYPQELHVEIRKVVPSDFAYILESLGKVFRAAVETGNPVRWC
jgi:hypothetical protein